MAYTFNTSTWEARGRQIYELWIQVQFKESEFQEKKKHIFNNYTFDIK